MTPSNSMQTLNDPQASALEIRPIRDIFELWTVYGLTHECYVETGYIHPRPTSMLVHYAEFDHLPETTVWVAIQNNEIVGSISTTIDGPSGFIIEKDYRQECQWMRREGRWMADFWRFVIKKNCRAERSIMTALMMKAGQTLLQRGVMTFLLDVHEKHAAAYQRLFNGKIIARRDGVPGLEQQHIAAVLMRWDVESLPTRWVPTQTIPGVTYLSSPSPTSVVPGLENAKQMAETYEQRLQPARQRFYGSPIIHRLTSEDASQQDLLYFLINYYAFHIIMNRPTESWTRRAYEKCSEMGLIELDGLFKVHAEQQAHLNVLLSADLKSLVSLWNKLYQNKPLDAEALVSRRVPDEVQEFLQINKQIIVGSKPYLLFALKYEMDRLLLEYGAWTVKRCVKCLGNGVLARLTYLQKKAVLDVEQIQFTWLELGKLLAGHPHFLDSLVETGHLALASYQAVLESCLTIKEQATEVISQPIPLNVVEPTPAAPRVSKGMKTFENLLAKIFPAHRQTFENALNRIHCPDCNYLVPAEAFDEINGRCLPCSIAQSPTY